MNLIVINFSYHRTGMPGQCYIERKEIEPVQGGREEKDKHFFFLR